MSKFDRVRFGIVRNMKKNTRHCKSTGPYCDVVQRSENVLNILSYLMFFNVRKTEEKAIYV